MNNSKYHFRAVTKPNDLLAIFSSNHDRGNFFKLFFLMLKQRKNLISIKYFLEILTTMR